MPLYDFKCSACGHSFERLTRASDETTPCSRCAEPAARLVSAPKSFHWKGGGFYETDFKTK